MHSFGKAISLAAVLWVGHACISSSTAQIKQKSCDQVVDDYKTSCLKTCETYSSTRKTQCEAACKDDGQLRLRKIQCEANRKV